MFPIIFNFVLSNSSHPKPTPFTPIHTHRSRGYPRLIHLTVWPLHTKKPGDAIASSTAQLSSTAASNLWRACLPQLKPTALSFRSYVNGLGRPALVLGALQLVGMLLSKAPTSLVPSRSLSSSALPVSRESRLRSVAEPYNPHSIPPVSVVAVGVGSQSQSRSSPPHVLERDGLDGPAVPYVTDW